MSKNFDELDPDERLDAVASRRAEAMDRYLELKTGQGTGPQRSMGFDRPVYRIQERPSHSQPEHADWLRAVDTLKKHWRLSAVFAAMVVISVTVFTLMKKPIYEPQARVEVDPPGAEVFSLQGNNNSGAATDYME